MPAPPPLVDFLGIITTASPSPNIGDIFFRDESGGFQTLNPPSSPTGREILRINTTTGHPEWVDVSHILGSIGLHSGRFIGTQATTGPPTTGTWVTGDWMIDGAGTVHQCTAGGTPGSWS